MRKLRNRFERFCYAHRNWGIPNLMLYITIGTAIVGLITIMTDSTQLLELLCFDKASILKGQVWRLFTYVFTDRGDNIISLLLLYFFYMMGRNIELSMGTFRFNLLYFTGVILMDVFAMVFCPSNPYLSLSYAYGMYIQMGFYLHLSLMLTFAVAHPDAQFLVLFIIPIKAWILSVIYLFWILTVMFKFHNYGFPFPHYLFPLVGVANFLLFSGKEVLNLLPPNLRPTINRPYQKVKQTPPKRSGPIPYTPKQAPKTAAYTHRCTICGRTDVTNPELEFRYCSRCNGYHCYCEDHINNHTHIE